MLNALQEDASIIKTILQKHGLSDQGLQKSTVGFRNTIWLTDTAVVKCYGENHGGYHMEKWFYETAHPEYAPRLLDIGDHYIIMERLHGTGLFRIWRGWSDAERENAVSVIGKIAESSNCIPWQTGKAYLPTHANYGLELMQDVDTTAEVLISTHAIPKSLAYRAKDYVHHAIQYLHDTELYLVYNDLHFDNLLVEKTGRIRLLDFEMLDIAPKDLVLDVWQRMLIHPFTYANEEDHVWTVRQDYQHLLTWMQKYAPSLFDHPHVRERVNLYGIRYELDILRSYPMAQWPMERLQTYMEEQLW